MLVISLKRLTVALFTAALIGSAAFAGPASGPSDHAEEIEIPFAKLGEAFQKANCPTETSCDLQAVLDRNYLRIPLGVYEFLFPTRFLGDKKRAKEIQELSNGLLDVQRVWIGWLSGDDAAKTATDADVRLLKAWVDGWDVNQLKQQGEEQPGDFHGIARSSPEVLAALERLATLMHDGQKLGVAPNRATPIQISCCPTRRNFMEVVGFCGARSESWQKQYWIDGIDQWTEIWVNNIPFLALEYAPWEDLDIEFSRGLSMKKFDKTGLVEHFTEHAALALMRFCLPGRDGGHFEKAMAMNVAIEVCGQVNTVDGEGGISATGGRTQPYSRFVPGGNPDGGILPPMSAAPLAGIQVNQWRDLQGKDHFTKALRKGQKAGAKKAKKDRENPLAKDKYAHFLLEAAEGGAKQTVSAPFFGASANLKKYPEQAVIKDYRQFFRSYKCGFFHWVRAEFSEDSTLNRDKFSQLMSGLARVSGDTAGSDAVFQEVYGVPISSADGEADSLEWRYLKWLGTGK